MGTQSRPRKDVMVFRNQKGTKSFEVMVNLKDELGALADVAERLAAVKVNVLEGFISSPRPDATGAWCFFATGGQGLAAAEVQKILAESPFVVGAKVREDWNGLIMDTLAFPLTWNTGDRAIMLRAEFFTYMEKKIREVFADGADTLLYLIGLEHGRPTWLNLANQLPLQEKEGTAHSLQIYGAVGWAVPELKAFDAERKTASVVMRENFECMGRKSSVGTSHFVRGHLAGAFTAIFGKEVKCEEVRCIAKGDEACEFQIS